MIKILETIWNFIKSAFSPKYMGLTFGVIILVLVTSLFKTCGDLGREKDGRKNDATVYENNIKANTDSLKTYYNKKLDAMVTEKTSYMINEISDLKLYNKNLYNEFKGVKNLVTGIKSDVAIIIPTLTDVINNKPVPDPNDSTKWTLPFTFNYKDEGLTQNLKGNTHFRILENKPQIPIVSTLTTNEFDIKIKYSIKNENGKSIVQATSPSKLVTFTELDGVLVLAPTKKSVRFVFGPQVGFGLNTDIVGQGARFGWNIGVGGTYNIFVK